MKRNSLAQIFAGALFLSVLCSILLGCPARQPESTSKSHYRTLRVHDGDTITLVNAHNKVKVRVFAVDCPELDQPYGKAARTYTRQLLSDQELQIQTISIDPYGRTVARVFLEDGSDLSNLLIEQGLAYWHRKYGPKRKDLEIAEEKARQARKGIWSQKSLAPWQYRYHKRIEKNVTTTIEN